jgi:hypothetical protein
VCKGSCPLCAGGTCVWTFVAKSELWRLAKLSSHEATCGVDGERTPKSPYKSIHFLSIARTLIRENVHAKPRQLRKLLIPFHAKQPGTSFARCCMGAANKEIDENRLISTLVRLHTDDFPCQKMQLGNGASCSISHRHWSHVRDPNL